MLTGSTIETRTTDALDSFEILARKTLFLIVEGRNIMSSVFSAGLMGSLELPNRLIHSATFECMAAEDGTITEPLVKPM